MSYLVYHCLSKLPQSPDGVSLSLRVSYSTHIHGKYPPTPIICWAFFISVRLSLMNIRFLYFHDILSWEKLCEETQSSECLKTPHNHFYFVVLFSSSSWPFPGSEMQGHTVKRILQTYLGLLPITRIQGLGFSFFFQEPTISTDSFLFCISSQNSECEARESWKEVLTTKKLNRLTVNDFPCTQQKNEVSEQITIL